MCHDLDFAILGFNILWKGQLHFPDRSCGMRFCWKVSQSVQKMCCTLAAVVQPPDQREPSVIRWFPCSKTLTSLSTICGEPSMDANPGKRPDGIADHEMFVCDHHFQTCEFMRVLRSDEAGPLFRDPKRN